MDLQHIQKGTELVEVMQALPADARHLIIDAIGLPLGIVKAEETLTDYVYRIQDELVRA